jgi:hypothetical protein
MGLKKKYLFLLSLLKPNPLDDAERGQCKSHWNVPSAPQGYAPVVVEGAVVELLELRIVPQQANNAQKHGIFFDCFVKKSALANDSHKSC